MFFTEGLFYLFLFYIWPFFISVVLPALCIPRLAFWLTKQKVDRKVQNTFTALVIMLAIIATLFWQTVIFNSLYFEWDGGFLSYSFTYHETPLIGVAPRLSNGKLQGEGSWIRADVGMIGLAFVWLFLTYGVYVSSGVVTYVLHKNSKPQKQISLSVLSLCLFSLPFMVPQLAYLSDPITIFCLGKVLIPLMRFLGLIH